MSLNLCTGMWRTTVRQIRNPNQTRRPLQACFSSNSSDSEGGFRPRRPSTYRQDVKSKRFSFLQSKTSNPDEKKKEVDTESLTDMNNTAEWQRDPDEWIDFLKQLQKENTNIDAESGLRMMDFFTAARGSTEDLVGRRRALMYDDDPDSIVQELERISQQELYENDFKLGEEDLTQQTNDNDDEEDEDEMDDGTDPNQLAYGDWSEMVVKVDRVQKVQRGGTMVRYRALVVGGNANGVAGFGVAKSNSPQEATESAARMCKRNIFFLDRYKGQGLTTDLVGKHNSCQVILRSVSRNYGLHGHPLIQDICKLFGLTDVSSKTHGNRNVYNVVRATFKAIITHESLEEIALKRGKRLLLLDRAAKMQL